MRSENPKPLRCSFCNKTERDVRKLVAGPAVYICDQCVQVCADIIADDDRFEARSRGGQEVAAPAPPADPGPESASCALCDALTPTAALVWIPGGGPLCAGCLARIEGVLEDRRRGIR